MLHLLTAFAVIASPALSKEGSMRRADNFAEIDAIRGDGGGLALRFYDAVTGKPIAGATVVLDSQSARTDRDGRAMLPWPKKLAAGDDARALRFTARGYITTDLKVRFQARTLFNNRFSISPKLPTPKHVRIVLDWGRRPADLDAHLKKSGSYHISYRHKKSYRDRVNLDRDDVDGEGPETITIRQVDDRGTYSYFVHDYSNRSQSNSSALSKSQGRVMVFGDGRLLHVFRVPSAGTGRTWEVFTIKGGEVRGVGRLR
ncbi:MAG: hypothetical protein CMH55_04060 [Myxococcales bacterium]|nr:hypothetical protein [Myxococcales bacterium]